MDDRLDGIGQRIVIEFVIQNQYNTPSGHICHTGQEGVLPKLRQDGAQILIVLEAAEEYPTPG